MVNQFLKSVFIVFTVNVLTEIQRNAISGLLYCTSGQVGGILGHGNDAESISEVSFMLAFIVLTVNVLTEIQTNATVCFMAHQAW